MFYRVAFTRLMATSPEPKIEDAAPNITAPGTGGQKKRPDYQVILKRNLFGPSKKETKTDKTTPSAADLAATSLDLTLLGTISGSPKNRRAIILDKKKKIQDIYFQGDMIQGALIKEIQRGKIILNRNGKDEILVPETPKTNSTPPTNPALFSQTPPEIIPEPSPEMPSEGIMEPEPIEPIEPIINSTAEPNDRNSMRTLNNRLP
ncbi:MAG: type II secretion system protein N [Desulfocapsaceae bacterium]|nr:type II secretion system protein N [Desulfocapsaceae bacterium]